MVRGLTVCGGRVFNMFRIRLYRMFSQVHRSRIPFKSMEQTNSDKGKTWCETMRFNLLYYVCPLSCPECLRRRASSRTIAVCPHREVYTSVGVRSPWGRGGWIRQAPSPVRRGAELFRSAQHKCASDFVAITLS